MVFPVSFHYVSMNQNRLLLFFKVSLVWVDTKTVDVLYASASYKVYFYENRFYIHVCH